MIKFFCRGCGKEMWEGLVKQLIDGEVVGSTINELWNSLYCSDCVIARFRHDLNVLH